MNARLLDGVRVVEFGHFLLMPMATLILADWGADIIKIENFKAGGDATRFPGPINGQPPPDDIKPSMWYYYANRNKRCIGLDVMTERGREILFKLVKQADVFAANYDLHVMEKAKADYDTLSEVNPSLIYCYACGFGNLGPDKYKPGFDASAFYARSGLMERSAESGQEPQGYRPGMGDCAASLGIAGAICAALLYREKTGEGQRVDVNLYHVAAYMLNYDMGTALHQGVNLPTLDSKHATNAIWNNYKSKDGRWLMLQMAQTDRYWTRFCKAIGKSEWATDPRFDTHLKRMEERAFLIPFVEELMASKTADEWEAIAEEYDLIIGRALSPVEVANDPQAWENGFFEEVEYEPGVNFKMINSPARFSKTPATIRSIGPQLGQHTEEILLEHGYTWNDLVELKDQGVIN